MISKQLNEKLSEVRLLVMDVDGTMTDSSKYYSSQGEELKKFDTRDGMGVVLLKKAGIDCAIITSDSSQIAVARGKKLGITNVILNSHNKSQDLNDLANKLSLNLSQIAYIGDDVNDLYAMKLAGASACPINAVEAILDVVDYVSNIKGGQGAVRDFAEKILISQNKPLTLEENW